MTKAGHHPETETRDPGKVKPNGVTKPPPRKNTLSQTAILQTTKIINPPTPLAITSRDLQRQTPYQADEMQQRTAKVKTLLQRTTATVLEDPQPCN